ncbi:hypothetical protein K0M31_009694 [Melipona bicolor]|uniref:Uncharacterized protein n=1 Tax=Melipona bicolor TaxID=60889 RepID=A0AA40FP94_9HYME|nr:hypothetical protein K0M31_009694 [Melipona bicolor]
MGGEGKAEREKERKREREREGGGERRAEEVGAVGWSSQTGYLCVEVAFCTCVTPPVVSAHGYTRRLPRMGVARKDACKFHASEAPGRWLPGNSQPANKLVNAFVRPLRATTTKAPHEEIHFRFVSECRALSRGVLLARNFLILGGQSNGGPGRSDLPPPPPSTT